MEALNQAQHKAAEAMYRTAGAAGPEGAPGGDAGAGAGGRTNSSGTPDSGDVIDAEVVEEEKK